MRAKITVKRLHNEELKLLEDSMQIACAGWGYIHAGLGGYDAEVEHALEEEEESKYE